MEVDCLIYDQLRLIPYISKLYESNYWFVSALLRHLNVKIII